MRIEMTMTETTLLKKRHAMRRAPLPNCHDGQGELDWCEVLAPNDITTGRLRFVHDDVLAPGVSIGIHAHREDEEYYYIVSGSGTMHLDGVEHPVSAGDITAVYPGGAHGLVNDGNEALRVIVFSIG